MEQLGAYGIAVDIRPDDGHLAEAHELEDLGFTALWVHGGQLDRLERLSDLIAATETAVVAPGVTLPDDHTAEALTAFYQNVESSHPARLFLGLGAPHTKSPKQPLLDYVNDLAIPQNRLLLAAFGPHRLALARDHFAGALPMAFTPDQTARARDVLGPDAVLALGQFVVLDDDPVAARATARNTLGFLCTLPSYVASAERQGLTAADANNLSDRLIDAWIAHGTPAQVAARLQAQRQAGANHVYASVLAGDGQPDVLEAARLLAPHLFKGTM